jgi:hypothetical protein
MRSASAGNAYKLLLLVLFIVGIAVMFMADFHSSRESPFQNELFFGPQDKPEAPGSTPANTR